MNPGKITLLLSDDLGDGTARVRAYDSQITLRDLFAMAVLPALISVAGHPDNMRDAKRVFDKNGGTGFLAEGAYDWADAMLAARAKGRP